MKKADIYGITGSIVSCILLFLLLWFVAIPMSIPEEQNDEGIMVSFGETTDGAGNNPTPVAEPAPAKSTPVATPKPVKQEYMTSKDPNALAIAEQKKKDKQQKEALEKQRLEEIRIANEKKKKEQDAINNANNTMSGLFGNGGHSGSGTTSGSGTQGNPAGKGTSGGNSWSLTGRSLSGRLASPNYENDVEGKVTVNIRVDANGNVTSASIGSPTTISDQATRNAAISAAKSTRFTSGNGVATGSITYNFNLR